MFRNIEKSKKSYETIFIFNKPTNVSIAKKNHIDNKNGFLVSALLKNLIIGIIVNT